MATDRRFLPGHVEADATFRAWAVGIDAQIRAMGLVQTSDTGQFDPATSTRPVAAGYAGYRMYRFADALQATKPVFLKVEYGSGGGATTPALRVQAGTATNGAGAFTGSYVTGQIATTYPSSRALGTIWESFCSGSPSRLNLVYNLDPGGTAGAVALHLERTMDPDGTPNGNGIFYQAGGSGPSTQMLPFSGPMTGAAAASPWRAPAVGSQSSDGVNVALEPLPLIVGGKVTLASFLRYLSSEIPEHSAIQVLHLGALRTFMPIGDGYPQSLAHLNSPSYSLAFLWE